MAVKLTDYHRLLAIASPELEILAYNVTYGELVLSGFRVYMG